VGRRSDHSREDLRALTLAAARRVMASEGLRGLTARRLAKEIGYSPGTLYNMFENLDEVALRVNAELLDDLYEHLTAALAGQPDPRTALTAMARAYMDRARAEPGLWSALFEHRMAENRPLPDWYGARIARLFALAEEVLGPLFAPGQEAACHRSARVLWSALQGMTSLALASKLEPLARISAEAMADDLVATYLAGLEARLES
jgi:AcrR family transcriptional regulator